MTHTDDKDDEQDAPIVANLKSGLGYTDPDRYSQHQYPPNWDNPRRP